MFGGRVPFGYGFHEPAMESPRPPLSQALTAGKWRLPKPAGTLDSAAEAGGRKKRYGATVARWERENHSSPRRVVRNCCLIMRWPAGLA